MKIKYSICTNRLTLTALLLTVTGIFTGIFAQIQNNSVTDVDGNTYKTVVIGSQEWMKENLKTTKFNDKSDIQNITDPREWARATSYAYSWYNNNISNKDIYGALYNWPAVNTGKLCPAGWRVPTDEDWSKLIDFLGGSDLAGGKLKEINNPTWNPPNRGATNESGFSAIPGGYRFGNYWYPGDFYEQGINSYWWSGTEYTESHSWSRTVNNERTKVYRSFFIKNSGFSVRCIKNDR